MIFRFVAMKYDDNKLFVRGWYPYDITVRPNYELTMIGQAIAGIYSGMIYSNVDTFVAMLVLHICGQMSNLKGDLKKIHLYDKTDLRTRLKKIVQKHNYIARFVLKKVINSHEKNFLKKTRKLLLDYNKCNRKRAKE